MDENTEVSPQKIVIDLHDGDVAIILRGDSNAEILIPEETAEEEVTDSVALAGMIAWLMFDPGDTAEALRTQIADAFADAIESVDIENVPPQPE